ncbi:MAG TPA: hypothetical protein PLL69_00665 [Gemmatimonadales bacterium]|nr:hypothetical protein [Gemmatimonadales bacterium]
MAAAAAVVVGACAKEEGDEAAPEQASSSVAELASIKDAASKYQDIQVALADGYVPDPSGSCEVATMMGLPAETGAMGIHYFRPDLLQLSGPPNPRVAGTGTHTDFLQPAVLLYEPQADGSLELVGVENLVFADAWAAAGNTEPPAFQGVAFDEMQDDPATALDEAHNFEHHYDRHVWIFRENPSGVFAQFNPNVSCEHGNTTHEH